MLTVEAKKPSPPIPPVQTVATTSKKTSKTTITVTRKQTGDQLQNLSNGVGSYKESTAQLTAVKSDLHEIQLQMDKVMLAQGEWRANRDNGACSPSPIPSSTKDFRPVGRLLVRSSRNIEF